MATVLYDFWRSSAAYRVRIALNHLGIGYQRVEVDLGAGAHLRPENRARHPRGLVPTLQIDGLTLTQSVAIVEYLDETRGGSLLPEAPVDRVRVRAAAHAIAMDIHPVCNLSVARAAVAGGGITMEEWMQAFIPEGLAAVERMLTEGPGGTYAFGDTVSLADICLLPQVYNARRWHVDLTPMPRIRAIEAACLALPAFAAAHPDAVAPER